MNPCPKAAMREIHPSGLMSGIWKRGSALPRQISTLHKPKRSRDFRAMEPLRKRLWRRIGFKQTETRCWAASQVCERCRLAGRRMGVISVQLRFEEREQARFGYRMARLALDSACGPADAERITEMCRSACVEMLTLRVPTDKVALVQ